MARESKPKTAADPAVRFTLKEFRSDSGAAIDAAVNGKTVTVVDQRGKPQMHILRQNERLKD